MRIQICIEHCLNPKSVSSLATLFTKILEDWGLSGQTLEETIQELQISLQEEDTF
jgi:hypothetical protein